MPTEPTYDEQVKLVHNIRRNLTEVELEMRSGTWAEAARFHKLLAVDFATLATMIEAGCAADNSSSS